MYSFFERKVQVLAHRLPAYTSTPSPGGQSYMEEGLSSLLAVRCYRPQSDLVNYTAQIRTDFKKKMLRAAQAKHISVLKS